MKNWFVNLFFTSCDQATTSEEKRGSQHELEKKWKKEKEILSVFSAFIM